MTTCQEIRGGSCATPVERNWKFCPTCGCVLGVVEPPPSVAFRITPDQATGRIQLDYKGQVAVKVAASVGSDMAGAFSLPDTERLISAPSALPVQIDPSRCVGGVRGSIRIVTYDGTRNASHYWIPLPQRVHNVEIDADLAEGPRLVPDPSILFFRFGQAARTVRLTNEGDLPVRLDLVEPPAGFRSTGSLDRHELAPGEMVEVAIEPQAGARDGSLRVSFQGGGIIEVPIVCFPAPPPRPVVRYVVAIDFGTSNTTVGIRDTQTEEFEFLDDPHSPGKSSRFPTAVLLRGADPETWEYGQRAIDEYDPNRHQIVYELKSYMRTDREPFAKRWSSCTIDAIVTWYLRRLRLDIIEPELARRSAGSRSDVHFIFCLPVLDHGPQYERQRRRYETAIKASGILELGEYSFQYEPVCAALYFLQGRKSGAPRHSFDEGDQVLVFDSGGGTTDIAGFTVHEVDGAIEMQNVRQVGSHREGGEAGASHQFGGTTLTQLIGFYKYTSKPERGGGARLLAFVNEHDGRNLPTFDESLKLTESGFKSIVPADAEDGGESLRWHRRFPRFYRLVEDKKRALALLPDKDDLEMLYKDNHGEVYLIREDLDLIVDTEMKKVLDPMLADLTTDGEQALDRIRHVFAVGGNSNIARIREKLLKKFSDRQLAELTPDQRIMAVPVGALFAYDPTSDRPPYSVSIVDPATGRAVADSTQLESSLGVPIEKQVRLHPMQEYRLAVVAKWKQAEREIATFSIRNEMSGEGLVRWRVRLDGVSLVVETHLESAWREVWRYEL